MKVKHALQLASICCAIGLGGCHSLPKANKPSLTMEKIYHAPVQLFDFDLSSSALRGKLSLKQSCDPSGTSLDIRDQLDQQVRIDTFNLQDTQFAGVIGEDQKADLNRLTRIVLAMYQQRYPSTVVGQVKRYPLSNAEYVGVRLQLAAHPIDLAIQSRYGYAYVVVLNSALNYADAEKAQQQLQTLLKSLYIPGTRIKGSDSDLPLRLPNGKRC